MKNKHVISIGFVLVIVVIAVVLYMTLVTQSISDVKTEENIGETVRVRGEVTTVVKLGQLSGYLLKDDTDTIAISSSALPAEGTTVRVKGTLIRDTIFGYYIKVD